MKSIILILIIGVLSFLHQSESAAIADEDVVLKATYDELQAKALADFKKAIKSTLSTFAKTVDAVIKNSIDNQVKGKTAWNDVLSKLVADHKKGSVSVQNALKAATGANAVYGKDAADAIDRFYVNLLSVVVDVNTAFTDQLAAHVDAARSLTYLKNADIEVVDDVVGGISNILMSNKDGKGQTCLKTMTPKFASAIKTFQTSALACFEDVKIYLPFSTEFVKIKFNTVKCKADEAIQSLPACLKQITKTLSPTFASEMYTYCLSKYANMLENESMGALAESLYALAYQVQSDLEFITNESNTCGGSAYDTLHSDLEPLFSKFSECSPASST